MATYVSFPPVVTPTRLSTETTLTNIRLLRGFLNASQAVLTSVVSLGATRRNRSPAIAPVEIAAGVTGNFRQELKFSGETVKLSTESAVAYFVNAAPVAPPKGVIGLASIEQVLDPSVTAVLNGSRLVRGDSVPIYFQIQGQRLEGLQAIFKAKQRRVLDGSTPITIEKTTILETAPALDDRTGTEIITGNFELGSSDTDSFPDLETEMGYQFLLTNGQGRTYTIATGFFTVYPPL